MLSDQIRLRLAALNRQALPPIAPGAGTIPPPHFKLLSANGHAPIPAFLQPHSDATGGHGALAAGVEYENASGKHLRCTRSLANVCQTAAGQLTARAEASGARSATVGLSETFEPAGGASPVAWHPELAALAAHLPRGTLFLDLETCGFAGSMVFLVGLLWQRDGELVLDQLLARSYAEERAILETLWQVAADSQVLVTFNGKSFDWPMVLDRSTRHLLRNGPRDADAPPALVHCDLLHHARRRWKRRLPNCKLQTLERAICRRDRYEDISGAAIPMAYHDFVRGGDRRAMASILHHNALDLVTLAQVAVRMLAELAADQQRA